MKRTKRVLLVMVLLAVLVVIGVPCGYMTVYVAAVWHKKASRPPLSKITTPLPPAVVQDVCQKLSLPPTDRRCQPDAVAYSYEFLPDIAHSLRPGVTTYDEVESQWGIYCYEREPQVYTPSLELTSFRCWYDLRGDHIFPFVLTFTDDGKLYRVMASPTDD